MDVLVTGATGLLGSNLVRKLCTAGLHPKVLVRMRSDRRAIGGLPVVETPGDLLDLQSVAHAMVGVERVYHCAGLVRFDPRARTALREVNVEGTRNVLLAARRAGVRRVVHVSSISAVGYGPLSAPATEDEAAFREAQNPYAESKIASEQVAAESLRQGLEVVIANPGVVIGAYDVKPTSGEILLLVARGLARFYPRGGTNYVNATDVADGLMRLMAEGRPGERYILGGENLTHREFLTQCAEACGGPSPSWPLPERVVREAARMGDLLGWIAPGMFQHFNTSTVTSMQHAAYVSSGKAQRELGYRPRPVREGIRAAYQWFEQNGYLGRGRARTTRGRIPHVR